MKTFSSHHSLSWDTQQPKRKLRFAVTESRHKSDNPESITDLKSGALLLFYGSVLLATLSYFYYLNCSSIQDMLTDKKKPQAAEVVEPD